MVSHEASRYYKGRKMFCDHINLETYELISRLIIGFNVPRTFPVCACCLSVINHIPFGTKKWPSLDN